MLILIWLRGLLARRTGTLAAAAAGIALAVVLPALLGAFLSAAKATMTTRSIQRVPVDWQVERQPGQSLSVPMPGTSREVSFARIDGFESRRQGQTLTTGAGQVLGLPGDYAATFPGEMRLLAGQSTGPLLAQQTAANLHAAPGATITVRRPGLPDAPVTVTGVVELPAADSLFQRVGAPPGGQPQAPPTTCCCCRRPTGTGCSTASREIGYAPSSTSASGTGCRPTRRRRTPRSPGRLATWRSGWPAPAWSGTISALPWTPPVRTPCTPRCCSCSWGRPRSCSPPCSPRW
ncbi:hypothetical protein ACFQYP_42080 [Nonomuraea antimicrobica]